MTTKKQIITEGNTRATVKDGIALDGVTRPSAGLIKGVLKPGTQSNKPAPPPPPTTNKKK